MFFLDHDLTSIKKLPDFSSVPQPSLTVPATYMQYSNVKIKNKLELSLVCLLMLQLFSLYGYPCLHHQEYRMSQRNDQYVLTFLLNIQVGDVQHRIVSVCVSWFKKHPHNTDNGKPVTGNQIHLKQILAII